MAARRRMVCGNDPTAVLTPGDRQAVEDFRAWLTSVKKIRADVEPIPAGPDAARAAAQRLHTHGAHVHLVASGGAECLGGCDTPGALL